MNENRTATEIADAFREGDEFEMAADDYLQQGTKVVVTKVDRDDPNMPLMVAQPDDADGNVYWIHQKAIPNAPIGAKPEPTPDELLTTAVRAIAETKVRAAVEQTEQAWGERIKAVEAQRDALEADPEPTEQTIWQVPTLIEGETRKDWLARVVGEGVGAASTAWDSMRGTGVFHEATARSVVDGILWATENTPAEAEPERKPGEFRVGDLVQYKTEKTSLHYWSESKAGQRGVITSLTGQAPDSSASVDDLKGTCLLANLELVGDIGSAVPEQANLGLVSTAELLSEIAARISFGITDLDYRPAADR